MIVQLGFDYDINLDRILYTRMDSDTGDLKIFFDNGSVLELEDPKQIDSLQSYFKHNRVCDSK